MLPWVLLWLLEDDEGSRARMPAILIAGVWKPAMEERNVPRAAPLPLVLVAG